MKKYPYSASLRLILLAATLLMAPGWTQSDTEITPEIAERYEQMLVRTPQPGAALDRVLEYYATQGGGLEALQERWATAMSEGDAANYLILQGLLAERLRRPVEARELYEQAIQQSQASDPARLFAARSLATLETTEGNFPEAVAAWETALATENLSPIDRLDLMRSLALLHQRSFADDKAVAVWQNAMEEFPGDPYVLEEAGEAFLAAGDHKLARAAFEELRKTAERDPYRRMAASLRLARTAELEGEPDEAVAIYLELLDETSEGSWNQREVRGRIEELFRRKDDLPGLLATYEKRTETSPRDYTSLAAQSDVLEELGRGSDAIDRLDEAIELAPGRTDLRLRLVRLLSRQGRTSDAIAKAQDLAKPADASVEVLLVLGNLHWDQWNANQEASDREAALAAWKRIAPEDSRDLARIAQLAELLYSRGETEAAVEQWQRLVTLSPAASDARQRLAAVFVDQEKEADARAVLDGMVSEERPAPENFLTLARAQESLKWSGDARKTVLTGLEKHPDDYELLSTANRQAMDAADADAVAELLPRVWANAPNAFFADDTIRRHVSFLATTETVKDALDSLREQAEANSLSQLDALILLRLALSTADEPLARLALSAIESLGDRTQTARANADVAATFGSIEDQIAAQQAVAESDPRMAVDSLRKVAQLHADLGNIDESLKTLSGVIDRSPADNTIYRNFADIAARAGRFPEAISRLREGIRYVEDATPLRLQLAQMLSAQGDLDAAQTELQNAWEAEPADGRRMDIFRRQIELAMMSGKLDDLVSSLREKQSKERDGARYGAYLAEIFILQNDFLSAREELSRSLGQNPENTAAVNRLMELAERGGDQPEALRLSARLIELEPSKENRADHLMRLLHAGEIEDARALFDQYRAEIITDPAPWSRTLDAMLSFGLADEGNAILEEIAAAPQGGIEMRYELARLRLSQRNLAAAEEILWSIVEEDSFADGLHAVASGSAANTVTHPGLPAHWGRIQMLNRLQNEVIQSLQQTFNPHRSMGFSRRGMFSGFPGSGSMTTPGDPSAPTPENLAHVRAVLLLASLARAQEQESKFSSRLYSRISSGSVPISDRFLLFSALNYTDGLADLVREQAESSNPDPAADVWIASVWQSPTPELTEQIEIIKARAKENNPSFAFTHAISDLQKQVRGEGHPPNAEGREEESETIKKGILELLDHPGRAENASGVLPLASMAASAGDPDLAGRILDELESKVREQQGTAASITGHNPMMQHQIDHTRLQIASRSIADESPGAQSAFEDLLDRVSASSGSLSNIRAGSFSGPISYFRGGPTSMLLAASPDLTTGDASFPFPVFAAIAQGIGPQNGAETLRKWFESHDDKDATDPTPWSLGVIYGNWVSGNKEAALNRAEELHAQNPTPRSAALLLELYEKLGPPEKALEIIETAALQPGESPDIRALRHLRLLRATANLADARSLAERMIRTRLSQEVRAQLVQELNALGIQTQNLPQFSAMHGGRSTRRTDRSEILQAQINKLVEDGRPEEAEQIALAQLRRAFPTAQDYQTQNLRQNMLQALKSMGRLEDWKEELQSQLSADPGDVTAAIRLFETSQIENEPKFGAEALMSVIEAHPERVSDLSYVIRLMQRRSETQGILVDMLSRLMKSDAGVFASQSIELQQLPNMANTPESKRQLATAVAELDDDQWLTIALSERLAGNSSEAMILNQLADFFIQDGNPSDAIKLLKRARSAPTGPYNPHTELPTVLRLAELQLAADQSAEAKETLESLIVRSSSPPSINRSTPTISAVLAQGLMNSHVQDQGGDQLQKLATLAEQTGLLDLLVSTLDEQQQASPVPVPISLLLRTSLGRSEIGAEWKEIAESDSLLAGFFTISVADTVIKALATQDESDKLIPAFIAKLPPQVYQHLHGDSGLSSLSEMLPVLDGITDHPAVARHIEMILARTTADPNASQYLMHSQGFQFAVRQMIEFGMLAEARRLMDFTSAARNQRHFGNDATFRDIERRLDAAEGKIDAIQIVLAGTPKSSGELEVHWQISPPVLSDQSRGGRGNQAKAVWETKPLPIPQKLTPAKLEILAGTNAVNLKKVATVSKPGQEGSTAIKVDQKLGLLQARWTHSDGTNGWGPLTVFVSGDNLIENQGIPPEGAALRTNSYRTEKPGPLGKTSAVEYSATTAASNQMEIPLADMDVSDFNGLIIFVGWVSPGLGTNPPQVQMKSEDESGNIRTDNQHPGQSSPGQWQQSVLIRRVGESDLRGVSSLAKGTTNVQLTFSLNFWRGYNTQYNFSAAWDGLQFIRSDGSGIFDDSSDLIRRAGTEASAGDEQAALATWREALETNPSQTLQNGGSNLLAFCSRTGNLDKLFDWLAAPALYLADPLRGDNVAFQNDGYVAELAAVAAADGTPPEAAIWLKQMAGTPLQDSQRFAIDAAIWLTEVSGRAQIDKEETTREALEILGFKNTDSNHDRLRQLWTRGGINSPTIRMVNKLLELDLNETALAQLAATDLTAEVIASRQMLEAWLLAESDPAAALDLWQRTASVRRGGENSVSFHDEADRQFLRHLASWHPEPDKLVAAVQPWIAERSSELATQRRMVVELLYLLFEHREELDKTDSPDAGLTAQYAEAWMNAELAALKIPGYSPSRDRIRRIANILLDAGDWQRVDELLQLARTHESLESRELQNEFDQLAKLLALTRGDFTTAWPVAWTSATSANGETAVHWQWNIRDVNPSAGVFDMAVSVADKPVLPKISGQKRIEVHFGEIPSSMMMIAQVDGDDAQGMLTTQLPASAGFLRVVAIFDDQPVPGPLVPVVTGKRIYPADGTPLRAFLTSGEEPMPAEAVAEDGVAPDGSPAVVIRTDDPSRRINFVGAEVPLSPDKFYIQRAWLRRAGTGTGTLRSEFRPGKDSSARTLNMILSENSGTTGQWVLYTRAVPTFPEHTFWIPYREINSVVPRFGDAVDGTKLAGWELFEVDEWAYSDWIGELATLREREKERQQAEGKDAAPISEIDLDRALELAAIEPLTALDYHGSWLVQHTIPAGLGSETLELFRAAFDAEANPLFARPKFFRIFRSLTAIADHDDAPLALRREAAALGITEGSRATAPVEVEFLRRKLALAENQDDAEATRAEVITTLSERLALSEDAQESNRGFFANLTRHRGWHEDREQNPLFTLLTELRDAELMDQISAQMDEPSLRKFPTGIRALIPLTVETCRPEWTPTDEWTQAMTSAMEVAKRSSNYGESLYWLGLVGNHLAAVDPASDSLLEIRRAAFQRAKQGDRNNATETRETLRAARSLMVCIAARDDDADLAQTAEELHDCLSKRITPTTEVPEDTMRIALQTIALLNAQKQPGHATSLAQLTRSHGDRYPNIKAAFEALP